MIRVILALLFVITGLFANSADSKFEEQPKAILLIAGAAQKFGNPLRSFVDGPISYYLRSAEYIGSCDAPFGTVQIARLFFIRSGPKGSTLPARGHTFIVFLDRNFTIRSYWAVDNDFGILSINGTTVFLRNKLLFDYATLPKDDQLVVDGSVQCIPCW